MSDKTGTAGVDTKKGKETPAREPKPRGAGLAVFLSLLSLTGAVAAVGGGYYFYSKEYVPLKQGMEAANTALQQQLSAQSEAVSDQLQQQLLSVEQINRTLVERQEMLQGTFDGITQDLNILKYKSNWGQREWTLAEVGYLLRMADDRLKYMRDVDTTRAALRTAIRRIEDLGDPSLASLQQQMHSDLQALNLYIAPDAIRILSRLEGMIAVLRPFPVLAVKLDEPNTPTEPAVPVEKTVIEEEKPRWLEFVENAKTQLENRVRVVRHEQRLNALDQNTVRQYQLEMATLRLEAMRMSLQRDDAAAFQRELLALDGWAQSNLTDKHAAPIREELQRLASDTLFRPLPSLSGSWQTLKTFLGDAAGEPGEMPVKAPAEVGAAEVTVPGAAPAEVAPESAPVEKPEDAPVPVPQPESAAPAVEPVAEAASPVAESTQEIAAPAPQETPLGEQAPTPALDHMPEIEPPAAPTEPQDVSSPPDGKQAVPLPEAVMPAKEGKPEVL